MNIPHMTGSPPVSAFSSVTLTFITTLDGELNLDCPLCAFIRCAEATVALDYRGLWLQRRNADLKPLRRELKVVSLLFTQPWPTNTRYLLSRARLAGIEVQEDYPFPGFGHPDAYQGEVHKSLNITKHNRLREELAWKKLNLVRGSNSVSRGRRVFQLTNSLNI